MHCYIAEVHRSKYTHKMEIVTEDWKENNEKKSIESLINVSKTNFHVIKSVKCFSNIQTKLFKIVKDYIHPLETTYETHKCEIEEKFPQGQKCTEKNDVDSEKLLCDGKLSMQLGFYYNAVLEFTNAIKLCSSNSLQIAECYARRSCALYSMKLLRECIKDIQRAESIGVPKYVDFDLVNRREAAVQKLSSVRIAQPSYGYHLPIDPNDFINSGASNVIIHGKQNKHITANKDIKVNDVVTIERPFMSACIEINEFQCYHCMAFEAGPIPCPFCIIVHYCSEECRMSAWKAYHRYECGVINELRKNKQYGIVWKLALSVFYYLDYECDNTITDILTLRLNQDYLATEQNGELRMAAAEIFHVIANHSDFIMEAFSIEPQLQILKGLIMILMYIQSIYAFRCIKQVFLKNNTRKIFSSEWYSISPHTLNFKHSCVPNVMLIFLPSNNTAQVRALHDIKKGDELFISYGDYNFGKHSKLDRKNFLYNNFCYTCRCIACRKDWSWPAEKNVRTNKGILSNRSIIIETSNVLKQSFIKPQVLSKTYEEFLGIKQDMLLKYKETSDLVLYYSCFLKIHTLLEINKFKDAFTIVINQLEEEDRYSCDKYYANDSLVCKCPKCTKIRRDDKYNEQNKSRPQGGSGQNKDAQGGSEQARDDQGDELHETSV